MTDAIVYKLYSHRPLSTAANQQLAVSTGTIATYFGNLAPPCGYLHAVVHELCSCANWRYRHLTGAPIGAMGPKGLSVYTKCLNASTPMPNVHIIFICF